MRTPRLPIIKFPSLVDICGITIHNHTMQSAIHTIEQLVQDRHPTIVVTPNVDHVIQVQHDPEFHKIYQEADLVLCDGVPLLWAARILGTPIRERVAGSDLFTKLSIHSAGCNYRLFFLGGKPQSAQKAARRLQEQHPGINIVGTYSPPFGFDTDPDEIRNVIQLVQGAAPDILFVGLGTPKQEKWIYGHRDELGVPVSIGIGASFEFVSGAIRRAPRIMQKAGLEWLWRLIQEPRRLWRRYILNDSKFALLVLRQKLKKKSDISSQ